MGISSWERAKVRAETKAVTQELQRRNIRKEMEEAARKRNEPRIPIADMIFGVAALLFLSYATVSLLVNCKRSNHNYYLEAE